MTNKSKISAVELTRDPLWIGDYALYQPKKGYRFTLDALLLGAVVPLFAGASLLELGCGSGVLPLIFLGREPQLRITGIESMDQAFDLAEMNMISNGVAGKVRLIHGDAMRAAELLPSHSQDIIVTNPPYYPAGCCRIPKDPDVAAAKTELYWNPAVMMRQAAMLLRQKGILCMVMDMRRKSEMLHWAAEAGLYLQHCADVFMTVEDKLAHRVLLTFSDTEKEPELTSLRIYEKTGEMTPEAKRIFGIYHGTGTVPCGDAHWESR